jgi:signal peptidase I
MATFFGGKFHASRWGQGCVLFVLAAIAVETWLVGGWIVPYRISGDSMAETLRGLHRDVTCRRCGWHFSCGTDAFQAAVRAVCPNCGFAANDWESLPQMAADRVWIDRTAFAIRTPRRWEVAAFEQPAGTDGLAVKRIVGLPGELIEIRHGDVYADGKIQRKNLEQQHALAMLVHDADFSSDASRWQSDDSKKTRHCWTPDGEAWCSANLRDRQVDWLVYHHDRASPVTDLCGYNPSQTQRAEDVHPVADLMLSFGLSDLSGDGAFLVRIGDGYDGFEVRWKGNGECSVVRLAGATGQSVSEYSPTRQPALYSATVLAEKNSWLVEVSLVDRQFLFAINGRTQVIIPVDDRDMPKPPACALAIGVQGLQATVSHLRIHRDVYYTDPLRPGRRNDKVSVAQLGADEYYVLGDNSPVSEDSRMWTGAAVDAKSLIGKPLVAIPSTLWSPRKGWHFQVPNLSEIRYIR